MGKKLAIKGHSTRGKEVIELLEMIGGKNTYGYTGDMESLYFSIYNDTIIYGSDRSFLNDNYVFFTLEEFLEKFPFKVGDKVVYTKFGDNCDDYPVTIESMKWTGTTIEYTFNDCVTCLAKDLKIWNGEPDTVISGIYLNSYDYADEVELNLGDYEIEVRDGKTYAVRKKSRYPKTYDECCKVVNASPYIKLVFNIDDGQKYSYDVDNLQCYENIRRIKICRDAYWKIAGKEMGLNKPWDPDWKNRKQKKYCIYYDMDNIQRGSWYYHNSILAFPTKEMRSVFYENFKDLIESCKELL